MLVWNTWASKNVHLTAKNASCRHICSQQYVASSRSYFLHMFNWDFFPLTSLVYPLCWAAGNQQSSQEGCGRTGHCAGVAGGPGAEEPPLTCCTFTFTIIGHFFFFSFFLNYTWIESMSLFNILKKISSLFSFLSTWRKHWNIYVFYKYIFVWYIRQQCTFMALLPLLFFWFKTVYYFFSFWIKCKLNSWNEMNEALLFLIEVLKQVRLSMVKVGWENWN